MNFITVNNIPISIITDNDNNIWYKANNIAKILKYSDDHKAYIHVDKNDIKSYNELKVYSYKYKFIKPNTKFINKKGIETLIDKTKKFIEYNLIYDLIIKLNLNANKIIKYREQQILNKIIQAFKNEEIILYCTICKYKINLYFPVYKIAIMSCNLDLKKKKQIEKKISSRIINFDTNITELDIHDIINEIYLNIKFNEKIINFDMF